MTVAAVPLLSPQDEDHNLLEVSGVGSNISQRWHQEADKLMRAIDRKIIREKRPVRPSVFRIDWKKGALTQKSIDVGPFQSPQKTYLDIARKK